MNKEQILDLKIDKIDEKIYNDSCYLWDHLSKPIDGLGDFEKIISRICAIKGTLQPSLSNKMCVVMIGDNGIVREGVSQCGSDVTCNVARMLGIGKSTLCNLARSAGANFMSVDVGIDSDESFEGVLGRKVRRGARDFLTEPALTEAEVLQAIETGIDVAGDLAKRGVQIICTGEMGIGNTTSSTAILCALTGKLPHDIAGRGAGLDDEGLSRKKRVIDEGLRRYDFGTKSKRIQTSEVTNELETPDYLSASESFRALESFGGLEIAAMVGLYIGGALNHIPVVIDGLVSAVAALLAERLCPGTVQYMIPSIDGREKGCMAALDELGLTPLIKGNIALGEGTGAVLVLPLLDMCLTYFLSGGTFSDFEIEDYKRF